MDGIEKIARKQNLNWENFLPAAFDAAFFLACPERPTFPAFGGPTVSERGRREEIKIVGNSGRK